MREHKWLFLAFSWLIASLFLFGHEDSRSESHLDFLRAMWFKQNVLRSLNKVNQRRFESKCIQSTFWDIRHHDIEMMRLVLKWLDPSPHEAYYSVLGESGGTSLISRWCIFLPHFTVPFSFVVEKIPRWFQHNYAKQLPNFSTIGDALMPLPILKRTSYLSEKPPGGHGKFFETRENIISWHGWSLGRLVKHRSFAQFKSTGNCQLEKCLSFIFLC